MEVDVIEDEHTAAPGTAPTAQRYSGSSASSTFSPSSQPAPQIVSDENKVCRSPITGIVVRVSAQEGQEIHVDDPLMVLEAMKMESSITSPVDGRIKAVNVKAGDSVKGRDILVEFE